MINSSNFWKSLGIYMLKLLAYLIPVGIGVALIILLCVCTVNTVDAAIIDVDAAIIAGDTMSAIGIGYLRSMLVLIILAGICGVIALVAFYFSKFSFPSVRDNFEGCFNKSMLDNYSHVRVRAERNIDALQEKLERLNEKKQIILGSYSNSRVDNARANFYAAKEELALSIKSAKDLARICETAFEQTLNIRDWDKLDLVIYAVETGRADNRKEALNYIDASIQRGAIAQEVRAAANEIKGTIANVRSDIIDVKNTVLGVGQGIRGDVAGLRANMLESFSGISRQVEAVQRENVMLHEASMAYNRQAHEEQMGAIEGVSRTLEASNARLGEIASVQNLQLALQRKATATGEQLLREVETIKRMPDHVTVEIR